MNSSWAPSSSKVLRFTRSFHQSVPRNESVRQRTARLAKARNIAKQEAMKSHLTTNKPHPVLGLDFGEKGEEAWKTTKLFHALVKKEDLEVKPLAKSSSKSPSKADSAIDQEVPKHLHFGLKSDTAGHLLNTLPQLTVEQTTLAKAKASDIGMVVEDSFRPPAAYDGFISRSQPKYKPYNYTLPPTVTEAAVKAATAQSSALSKIIDLKNASAQGIAFANRRRCIEAFSDPADGVQRKGPDTGRPEVQAALLTAKIRNLWDHLRANPRDIHNRRSLRGLVHQRAKVLKYLKKLDPARYVAALPDLGLDPRAVEGEIIIR